MQNKVYLVTIKGWLKNGDTIDANFVHLSDKSGSNLVNELIDVSNNTDYNGIKNLKNTIITNVFCAGDENDE